MSDRIPGARAGIKWVSGDTWLPEKGMTAADYAEDHGFPREAEVGIPADMETLPAQPEGKSRLPAPLIIDDPEPKADRIDAVRLAIGFDEGTLTEEELVQWARFLVDSGMEYSTGTLARFVAAMRDAGQIE